MASKAQTDSFRFIARVFGEGVVTGLTDAELVERFAATRDAEAFAAIVARHGPMVMARCRSSTPSALALAGRVSRGLAGASVMSAVFAVIALIATFGLVAARDTPEPESAPAASQTPAPKPAATPDDDDPKLAGHFVGRVLGPDGQPVIGARLFIAAYEPLPTKAGPVRAKSGADGRFEFDAPDMTYSDLDGLPSRRQGLLIATADGYAPDWVVTLGQTRSGFRSHSDPVKGAELTLQLARDDVPIHGRLLDHDGQPLAGARMRVTALQVPWKRDLDAHLKKYSGPNSRFVEFDYERSLYRPAVLPGVETEVTTGADGRFRISGLGRDRLADVMVTAPSIVETRLSVMTRDVPDVVIVRDSAGNPTQAILGAGFTLRLRPGRTLRGTVLDLDTHQPIAGAWIGQNVLHRLKHEDGCQPVTSDSNGRFTVSGIDPGDSKLELAAVSPPGQPYATAKVEVGVQSDVTIECARGIPFRLKLVDAAGMPVDADVEYQAVMPNPHVAGILRSAFDNGGWPISVAAKRADWAYEGFVIPGPGAVLVKTRGRRDDRPTHVDPKAVFAPGKMDWTNQELISAFGTHDTLIIGPGGSWIDQHDYAAIVLVNPPVGSKPLELSASVNLDKLRMATILGPDGAPIVGVQTEGLTSFPWDHEPPLRASTIPIRKLRPERGRRITFLKKDHELIGFLLARADGETPYTVQLQPWATVTGRILNEHGVAFSGQEPSARDGRPPAALSADRRLMIANYDDPLAGDLPDSGLDGKSRFWIERLIPGLRYTALIYRDGGQLAGTAFENLVLKPGEVRDLGDIPSKAPVDTPGK